jgi:hypothetical protein
MCKRTQLEIYVTIYMYVYASMSIHMYNTYVYTDLVLGAYCNHACVCKRARGCAYMLYNCVFVLCLMFVLRMHESARICVTMYVYMYV